MDHSHQHIPANRRERELYKISFEITLHMLLLLLLLKYKYPEKEVSQVNLSLSVWCCTSCKSLLYLTAPQEEFLLSKHSDWKPRKLACYALIVEEILISWQESFPHYFFLYWLAYFLDMNPSDKDGKNKNTPTGEGWRRNIENSYLIQWRIGWDINGNSQRF